MKASPSGWEPVDGVLCSGVRFTAANEDQTVLFLVLFGQIVWVPNRDRWPPPDRRKALMMLLIAHAANNPRPALD